MTNTPQTIEILTCVPAYGRDYRNEADVAKAWNSGKDFLISDTSSPWNNAYINNEDAKTFNVKKVRIRYNKLQDVVILDT